MNSTAWSTLVKLTLTFAGLPIFSLAPAEKSDENMQIITENQTRIKSLEKDTLMRTRGQDQDFTMGMRLIKTVP